MKKLLLSLILLMGVKASAFTVTNEVDMTVDSSSYDTQPYVLWLAYLATGFHNMYPQYTNSINSVSRSGASLENQFENQQEQYCLAHWCYAQFTNHVTPYDLFLPNDNSGYLSNDVFVWTTNLAGAPALMWNGTAKTNEGIGIVVVHQVTGANINSVAGGDSGAVSRNSGATNAQAFDGMVAMDTWHHIYTNITSAVDLSDVTGKNMFFALGHLTPQMALAQMMAVWSEWGMETNVGNITFDWVAVTVPSSNHFAAISLSQSGSSFSCTFIATRMPPSWDIETGVSNRVATQLWTNMPSFGSLFQWPVTFTNMPSGTYNTYIDGVLVDTCTAAQYAAGRNWATNGVVNNPFNKQRTSVLYAVRDKYGVDHVTGVNTHGAGENGINGADQINYQSNAFGQWTSGNRGATLVNNLSLTVNSLRTNYDVPIHNAAQQTNHTLLVRPLSLANSTTNRVGTVHYGL